jgi:hypothetical protein
MNRLIRTIKAYLRGVDVDKVISSRNFWRQQYETYYKKSERLKTLLKKAQAGKRIKNETR